MHHVVAAWCALNPLALLLIPLEMVSQPDGIGSKPLAIENSQVKRLHRPLWWFALPGGGWRGGGGELNDGLTAAMDMCGSSL